MLELRRETILNKTQNAYGLVHVWLIRMNIILRHRNEGNQRVGVRRAEGGGLEGDLRRVGELNVQRHSP